MSTEWFDKLPGVDLAQGRDDPAMFIEPVGCPDWVNVPADTGYGGRYRCLAVLSGPCPVQGHNHICRHYILDGPVCCAECVQSGKFWWYRKTE